MNKDLLPPKTRTGKAASARPVQYESVNILITGEVECGWIVRGLSTTDPKNFEYNGYHLGNEFHVTYSRKCRMNDHLPWRPTMPTIDSKVNAYN